MIGIHSPVSIVKDFILVDTIIIRRLLARLSRRRSDAERQVGNLAGFPYARLTEHAHILPLERKALE
ncbi:MAG: hypothetical protein ABR527_04785 [Gemmatimonadota bacterium]